MQDVGRSHEENLREVVFNVEVVVNKHEILFGIEDLEQSCRWIATKVHGHLVHFIQHEHWVLGPSLLHHLDNLAWKRADIGPAMTTNFGLVPNSA